MSPWEKHWTLHWRCKQHVCYLNLCAWLWHSNCNLKHFPAKHLVNFVTPFAIKVWTRRTCKHYFLKNTLLGIILSTLIFSEHFNVAVLFSTLNVNKAACVRHESLQTETYLTIYSLHSSSYIKLDLNICSVSTKTIITRSEAKKGII